MSKLSFRFRRYLVKWNDLQWMILEIKNKRCIRRETRINNECAEEAERRIQYREFDGRICIALDNIPVIPINEDGTEDIYACRELFQKYIFKKRV